MRMVDLIEYKKNNGEFNQQQIQFIIDGYVDGSIPDYQMSALLMAICFQGAKYVINNVQDVLLNQ